MIAEASLVSVLDAPLASRCLGSIVHVADIGRLTVCSREIARRARRVLFARLLFYTDVTTSEASEDEVDKLICSFRKLICRDECLRKGFENPGDHPRVELLMQRYNHCVTPLLLLIDKAVSSAASIPHHYGGTSGFWFSRYKYSKFSAPEIQRQLNAVPTLSKDFFEAIGRILPTGKYTVANLVAHPTFVEEDQPCPFQQLCRLHPPGMWNGRDPAHAALYDTFPSQLKSSSAHYRLLAPQWEGLAERVLSDELGDLQPLPFAIHTVQPLQDPRTLDPQTLQQYDATLRAGCLPTVLALGVLHSSAVCYDGNPWATVGLHSFLLDGHHKMHAAALAKRPLAFLVFVPESIPTDLQYAIANDCRLVFEDADVPTQIEGDLRHAVGLRVVQGGPPGVCSRIYTDCLWDVPVGGEVPAKHELVRETRKGKKGKGKGGNDADVVSTDSEESGKCGKGDGAAGKGKGGKDAGVVLEDVEDFGEGAKGDQAAGKGYCKSGKGQGAIFSDPEEPRGLTDKSLMNRALAIWPTFWEDLVAIGPRCEYPLEPQLLANVWLTFCNTQSYSHQCPEFVLGGWLSQVPARFTKGASLELVAAQLSKVHYCLGANEEFRLRTARNAVVDVSHVGDAANTTLESLKLEDGTKVDVWHPVFFCRNDDIALDEDKADQAWGFAAWQKQRELIPKPGPWKQDDRDTRKQVFLALAEMDDTVNGVRRAAKLLKRDRRWNRKAKLLSESLRQKSCEKCGLRQWMRDRGMQVPDDNCQLRVICVGRESNEIVGLGIGGKEFFRFEAACMEDELLTAGVLREQIAMRLKVSAETMSLVRADRVLSPLEHVGDIAQLVVRQWIPKHAAGVTAEEQVEILEGTELGCDVEDETIDFTHLFV